jgi:hypothetical protein
MDINRVNKAPDDHSLLVIALFSSSFLWQCKQINDIFCVHDAHKDANFRIIDLYENNGTMSH